MTTPEPTLFENDRLKETMDHFKLALDPKNTEFNFSSADEAVMALLCVKMTVETSDEKEIKESKLLTNDFLTKIENFIVHSEEEGLFKEIGEVLPEFEILTTSDNENLASIASVVIKIISFCISAKCERIICDIESESEAESEEHVILDGETLQEEKTVLIVNDIIKPQLIEEFEGQELEENLEECSFSDLEYQTVEINFGKSPIEHLISHFPPTGSMPTGSMPTGSMPTGSMQFEKVLSV
jgi:hypothetical protein